MLSIYKVSKSGFKTIFAMEFDEKPIFFFYLHGEWVKDCDDVDIKKMAEVYGETVDLELLNDLELGEVLDLNDGGKITCLTKFEDLESLEDNSTEILEFLDSYAKIMHMEDDF